MLGPVKNWTNDHNATISEFPLKPAVLAKLVELVESGQISFSSASSRLLPALTDNAGVDPLQLATSLNLLQNAGTGEIEQWVAEVLTKMPDKVAEYKKGKKGLIGLFMGEVKKLSKGKADPKMTTTVLEQKLNETI